MSKVNLVILEDNGINISVSDHKHDPTRLTVSVNKPVGISMEFTDSMYNAIMGVYAYKNDISIFKVIDAGYKFADNLAWLLLKNEAVNQNVNFSIDIDNLNVPALKYLKIGVQVAANVNIGIGTDLTVAQKPAGTLDGVAVVTNGLYQAI